MKFLQGASAEERPKRVKTLKRATKIFVELKKSLKTEDCSDTINFGQRKFSSPISRMTARRSFTANWMCSPT